MRNSLSFLRKAPLLFAAVVGLGGCSSSAEADDRGRARTSGDESRDLLAEPLDPAVPKKEPSKKGGLLSAPLDPPPKGKDRR